MNTSAVAFLQEGLSLYNGVWNPRSMASTLTCFSGVESEAFSLGLLNAFSGFAFMLTVSAGDHGLHTDSLC